MVVVADGSLATVQALIRWDPAWFALRELTERRELSFPPASRMASLTGKAEAVAEFLDIARLPADTEILGPVPADEEQERMLLRVPRSHAAPLARALHEAAAVRSAKKGPLDRTHRDRPRRPLLTRTTGPANRAADQLRATRRRAGTAVRRRNRRRRPLTRTARPGTRKPARPDPRTPDAQTSTTRPRTTRRARHNASRAKRHNPTRAHDMTLHACTPARLHDVALEHDTTRHTRTKRCVTRKRHTQLARRTRRCTHARPHDVARTTRPHGTCTATRRGRPGTRARRHDITRVRAYDTASAHGDTPRQPGTRAQNTHGGTASPARAHGTHTRRHGQPGTHARREVTAGPAPVHDTRTARSHGRPRHPRTARRHNPARGRSKGGQLRKRQRRPA